MDECAFEKLVFSTYDTKQTIKTSRPVVNSAAIFMMKTQCQSITALKEVRLWLPANDGSLQKRLWPSRIITCNAC